MGDDGELARGHNREGSAAFRRGSYAEAIASFTVAAENLRGILKDEGVRDETARRRELAVVLVNRARARLEAGEEGDAAVLDATEAVGANVTYVKAHRTLVEAYRAHGLLAEAAGACSSGLRAVPGDWGLEELASAIRSDRRRTARGEARVDIRLGFLPDCIRATALRALRLHVFGLALLASVVWLHRRPLMRAWSGADEPLTLEELQVSPRWWSGFGLGISFDAKLSVESLAEAGFETVQWDDLLEKAMGKKGRTVGRFLMLSWRLPDTANVSANVSKSRGKITCKSKDAQVCVLCFLSEADQRFGDASALKSRTVPGRVRRLRREHKNWLQKTRWRGDGILPLLFSVRSTRWQAGDETSMAEVAPDNFASRRVLLLVAVALAVALVLGAAAAARSAWDFTRHAAFCALQKFPDVALSAHAVAQEIEREVADKSPLTGTKVMQGGRVVITCSWLVHCPTVWTFFERLLQPLKMLLVCIMSPSTCIIGPLTSGKGAITACHTVVAVLREWVQLVRCSAPCGVEITRLKDCALGSRVVFTVDLGPNWDALRIQAQHRLVLRDRRLGIFIEIPGEAPELQSLAREIAMRQAVDHRAWQAGTGPEGANFFDGPLDPRNLSLDDCYEVLGLERADLCAAASSAEALLLVRRAFRRRALETHPDKAGEDRRLLFEFHRASAALEALRQRIEAGLDL